MTAPLALNTVQKARRFLDTLGFAPPVTASSDEVLERLVTLVHQRRDDAAVRRQLTELQVALARGEVPGRFPAATCETVDPDALAHELSVLLARGGGTDRSGALAGPAALGAVAALLMWAGATAGCDSLPPAEGDECTDLTRANFVELIDQSADLADCEYDEFADEFEFLPNAERRPIVADLCTMSAAEIADYLVDQFGTPECDDPWDDDDAYKGVTF